MVRNSTYFYTLTVTEIFFGRDMLFIRGYVDGLTFLTCSHVIDNRGITFQGKD